MPLSKRPTAYLCLLLGRRRRRSKLVWPDGGAFLKNPGGHHDHPDDLLPDVFTEFPDSIAPGDAAVAVLDRQDGGVSARCFLDGLFDDGDVRFEWITRRGVAGRWERRSRDGVPGCFEQLPQGPEVPWLMIGTMHEDDMGFGHDEAQQR